MNCFYTKMNGTKTSASEKESCSFKAKLQEKDIFLSLIMGKGRKDIYAIAARCKALGIVTYLSTNGL